MEEFAAGDAVFHYGDPGNHFYIIIQGSVDVRVPMPVQLEDEEATPLGLFNFIIENYDDIYWKAIDRKASIIQAIHNELSDLQIPVDSYGRFDKVKAAKIFET